MKRSRLLALLLCLLMLLSFAACGKSPEDENVSSGGANVEVGQGSGKEKEYDEKKVADLARKSDGDLTALLLTEYDKAISAAAYLTEYYLTVSLGGETLANTVGCFAVNGNDFYVDWVDYSKAENSVVYTYKDGVLYTEKNDEATEETLKKDAVQGLLREAGAEYRLIPSSAFASQGLTRQEDGGYLLTVTLTDEAIGEISAETLAEREEPSDRKTFQSASLSLGFDKDGSVLRSRLLSFADVTAEDGTTQRFCVEKYVKFLSFDASALEIVSPKEDEEVTDDAEEEITTTDLSFLPVTDTP